MYRATLGVQAQRQRSTRLPFGFHGDLRCDYGYTLPNNAAEDSYNLLPALVGNQTTRIRPDIVDHSIDGVFAIPRGDWKLEEGLGSNGFSLPREVSAGVGGPRGQLYNLAADPEERDNLYLSETAGSGG